MYSFWLSPSGTSKPPHTTVTTAFTNDPVAQKDKAVFYVGDPGLVHVQIIFEHFPAFLPDSFRQRLGANKVISITVVRHSKFPLPVFFECSTSTSLNTVIPVPAGFSVQVTFMQVLIELIQHDARQ